MLKSSFLSATRTLYCCKFYLQRNIVHRDLKLGNLVLHRQSRRVTLINFCLGKHLANENDMLRDQRGSPAYISPDVLSGKAYYGTATFSVNNNGL